MNERLTRSEERLLELILPEDFQLFVLVADYGDGQRRVHGVFSSYEKAAAAGFDAGLLGPGRVIETVLNKLRHDPA